jgi:hypothetical protein
MRVTLAAIIMALSLAAGTAVAGTGYDRCSAEEQALRTEAVDRCRGFSYLLNPSGCFIAQKALKAFDGDKCRALKAAEQTAPESEPPPLTVAEPPLGDNGHEKAALKASVPEPDMEQLKAENARLKAEIERLRAEMEQLRR